MPDIKKGGGLRSLAPIVDQTEQFLSKQNVPKEQVVPFLMSLGRPELAGAVADRMRLDQAAERMKSMQQGQSAPPTVAQENRMQAMQMGQMMAQRPQPMASGIQSVAPPQRMAGGGIVAFARGGNEGLDSGPDLSTTGYGAARAQLTAMLREAEAAGQIERAAQLRMQLDKLEGGIRSPGYLSEGARRSVGLPVETPQPPVATQPPPAMQSPVETAAPASAGFIAPDTQGELFDEMMRSASRPESPAAPAAAPVAQPAAAAKPVRRPAAPVASAATSASGIQIPDIAKPQTREQVTADRIAAEKAAGITGDATKAYEDFIKSREAGISEDKKAAYKNAWMMAGARLLGSRSPFFAQALGEAAEAGISGYQKDLKEIKAAEQAFKQASMQLAMNKEAIARGDLRADSAEVRRQEELYGNRQLKLYELQEKARDSALDRATQLRVAELRNATGGDSRIARLQGLYEATQEPGLTPQEKQKREDALARQLQKDREFTAAATTGGYAADIGRQVKIEQALINLQKEPSFKFATPEEQQRRINEVMRTLGGSGDYVPQSSNVRNPYEGFKATLID